MMLTREDDMFLWRVVQDLVEGSIIDRKTQDKILDIHYRWMHCKAKDFTKGTIPIYYDIAGKLMTIMELMGGEQNE